VVGYGYIEIENVKVMVGTGWLVVFCGDGSSSQRRMIASVAKRRSIGGATSCEI